MCFSVFQCVAVYCSTLQYVAVYCSVLQCVAVFCSVLQRVAVCSRVLQLSNATHKCAIGAERPLRVCVVVLVLLVKFLKSQHFSHVT